MFFPTNKACFPIGRYSSSKSILFFVLLVANTIFHSVAFSQMPIRTWSSSGGNFSVKASLFDRSQESVKLRKTDFSIIEVNLSKLSDADRQYADRFKEDQLVVEKPNRLVIPKVAIFESPSSAFEWGDVKYRVSSNSTTYEAPLKRKVSKFGKTTFYAKKGVFKSEERRVDFIRKYQLQIIQLWEKESIKQVSGLTPNDISLAGDMGGFLATGESEGEKRYFFCSIKFGNKFTFELLGRSKDLEEANKLRLAVNSLVEFEDNLLAGAKEIPHRYSIPEYKFSFNPPNEFLVSPWSGGGMMALKGQAAKLVSKDGSSIHVQCNGAEKGLNLDKATNFLLLPLKAAEMKRLKKVDEGKIKISGNEGVFTVFEYVDNDSQEMNLKHCVTINGETLYSFTAKMEAKSFRKFEKKFDAMVRDVTFEELDETRR